MMGELRYLLGLLKCIEEEIDFSKEYKMLNIRKWCKEPKTEQITEQVDTSQSSGLTQIHHDAYMWVDGYKRTDSNMKCKNDFQYEIGKTYSIEEEPIICKKGFHFCLSLEDCFHYSDNLWSQNNRFFNVKGYVRINDFDLYGTIGGFMMVDKLCAKEIMIVSEVSDGELLQAIKRRYDQVSSLEDLINYKSYNDLIELQIVNALMKNNFSELFSRIYADNVANKFEEQAVGQIKKKIEAIASEDDVSKDLKFYELMRILG